MKLTKKDLRCKKKCHIRKKITGTGTIPRLTIFKSNANFYAQVINDEAGRTLASASTLKLTGLKSKSNIEAAKAVANDLAQKMINKKIFNIVFDRSGYIYHGKVKAFADCLRAAGIKF